MKKAIALACAVLLVLGMTACAPKQDDGKYVIGICQLMTHDALDAATQGFKDALIAEIGEENLTFKHQDAAGKQANCDTIVDGFVSEKVDLILANATTPLQSAATKTLDIPILGTSVTEYGVAELRGKSLAERAKALIQIAHPSVREDLDRAAAARFGYTYLRLK